MNKPKDLKINFYELILTENCNLRCTYCFDDQFSDRTSCSYDFSMKTDLIDDLLNFIEETRDKNITVSFFGGEPTMNWVFIKEFINRTKGMKIRYTMNSNLCLLNSQKIDFLVKNKVNMIVSIDGIKEAHDKNRVYSDGSGSWDDTIKILPEVIAKYGQAKMGITALMVVNKSNYELLEKSYEFLVSLGIGINILYDYGDTYNDDFYDSVRTQLTNLFIKKGYEPYLDIKSRVLSERFHCQENYCHTPSSVVTISPNGKMFFCHQLTPKMYEINKDFNEYYGDIWEGYSTEYYDLMNNRTTKLNKTCRDCKAKLWCKGGCIAAHRFEGDDYNYLNPTLCKINLLVHKIFTEE